MKIFKLILILLFTTVIIVFALQNTESLTIHFFQWSLSLPVFVSVIAIYIIGGITGGLLLSALKKISTNTEEKE